MLAPSGASKATAPRRAADPGAAARRAVRRGRCTSRAAKASPPSRRTELAIDAEPRADVVVLDTIGELAQLYQLATVVFVGGSLVRPAATTSSSRPCSAGPSSSGRTCRTSPRSPRCSSRNDAAVQVRIRARARGQTLVSLMGDPVRRARLGAAARALVDANRGATRPARSTAIGRAPAAGRAVDVRPFRGCTDATGAVPAVTVDVPVRASAPVHAARYVAARPERRAPARAPGHQRRQPRRRRQRQDAARRAARAPAADAGERPAVLSAAATAARTPATAWSSSATASGSRADLARAGDEPLMLARHLPGVAVLVCPDRYLAGRLAEQHLGATVHVLDDGFQHLQLARDVDLLIVGDEDLERPRVLPCGPPARAARAARARPTRCSWTGPDDEPPEAPRARLRVPRALRACVARPRGLCRGVCRRPPPPGRASSAVAASRGPAVSSTRLRTRASTWRASSRFAGPPPVSPP